MHWRKVQDKQILAEVRNVSRSGSCGQKVVPGGRERAPSTISVHYIPGPLKKFSANRTPARQFLGCSEGSIKKRSISYVIQ
jgi:hypothetical protein